MEDNKNMKLIGAFVVVCLVIALIITVSQLNNNTLPGYNDDNNNNVIITTVAPYSAQTERPDMQQITDNTIGLGLYVPVNWSRVIKDGNTMFVDPETSAFVRIEKSPYVPGLLSKSSDQIQSELAAVGGHLISYQPDGNYGYTLLYQTYENNTLYDFIEITRLDLQTVARVSVCAPDDVYKPLESALQGIASSVTWNPNNPIPADFLLMYNTFGNFEFGVPAAWNRGIEDNEYVAKDPYTGAEMHVSVSESNATYAGVDQGSFSEYLSAGKDGFSIKQFTATDSLIYCVSQYVVNTFPVTRVEYLLATGAFEYAICFICPNDTYASIAGMFDQAFSLFRTF